MTKQTMTHRLALLVVASLALGCADAGRPSNVRQFDRLPNLNEALNVAKSPYEPVTLASSSPADVARTDLEPLSVNTSRLTPDEEENLRTTRSVEQPPEEERTDLASSSTTRGLEDGASSVGETSTTETSAEESSSRTEAPQAETTAAETETDQASKDELPAATTTSTTAAPEPANSDSASSTTQAPSETTTEAEVASSSSEETSSVGSVAPKEQEETTTSAEPETTTTTSETTTTATTTTTTTTTAAPETSQPETEAGSSTEPTTTTTEAATTTTTTTEMTPSSGPPELAESDRPKEQPVVELAATTETSELTSTTSSEPPSSTEPSTAAPTGSSLIDAENEQSQTTTTTTSTTPAPTNTEEATPSSSLPPVSSSEAPKLEGPKPKEEVDKSSCDHLPTYDSEEIQKVFREETTFRNGTIKGKFTYINFDQRYRLVHYTRLPYGPVKIDRVDELGKPGQSGQDSSHSLSSSTNDVLQLRNLLPNSLFGFPFLGPNAAANRPAFANRHEDPNTYFYATDSLSPIADPNLLDQRSFGSLASQSHRPDHLSQQSAPATSQHQAKGPHSRQLDRLDGPRSELPPVARVGHQFQYSSPFQGQNLASPLDTTTTTNNNNNKGFSYSYFTTSHSDHQPASRFQQPWTSPIYPAFPLRIGHQLNDPFESGLSRGHHHQPHSHEHYEAPFMFSQTSAEQLQSPAILSGDTNNPRLKLQVKTSKALNLNADQTKSAQLRLQPSTGHYSHLGSPSQMYQRNQQRQRLGKQSQQRHRSYMPAPNPVPVVYHVLSSPYNRRQFNEGHVMAYDQAD